MREKKDPTNLLTKLSSRINEKTLSPPEATKELSFKIGQCKHLLCGCSQGVIKSKCHQQINILKRLFVFDWVPGRVDQ